MRKAPIRRGHLVTPFGVGSLVVAREGMSYIVAGLDYWHDGATIDEFYISEWRLENALKVSHFRLPPDYREPMIHEDQTNSRLKIPALHFPLWHHCSFCHRLQESKIAHKDFEYCDCGGKTKRRTDQVRFITVCPSGHIQDFPWRDWVHKQVKSQCLGILKLFSGSSTSLYSQRIECSCGAKRSLGDVYTESNFDENHPLFCRGEQPWLGYAPGENQSRCGHKMQLVLRNATNVYTPITRTSLSIPRYNTNKINERLMEEIKTPSLLPFVELYQSQDLSLEKITEKITEKLKIYSYEEIKDAINTICNTNEEKKSDKEISETEFRRQEYAIIREERDFDDLLVRKIGLDKYEAFIQTYLGRIMLLHKLRVTQAFVGFNRCLTDGIEITIEEHQKQLWRKHLESIEDRWLPASVTHGEGIYLELNDDLLTQWEQEPLVQERIRFLVHNIDSSKGDRAKITPRFVLLHTLAHLLINRLTFDCGYSTTALKERLYVSDDPTNSMAGILIYTASGDADGTMGGLVRMGTPTYWEQVFRRAIEEAMWCSADPVCMEMAEQGGQGPNTCNLAACHSCCLLPETSCEQFNAFLDRGVVVGSMTNPHLGFFQELITQ